MSSTSGPGSRVPVPRGQRSAKRRAACRRGFVALVAALVVVIAGLARATSHGEDADRAGETGNDVTSPTGGEGPGNGNGDGGTGPTGGQTIVPGETPIEHVVFIIK